jgi:hypothetical protein
MGRPNAFHTAVQLAKLVTFDCEITAGLATELGPATSAKPKPMLSIEHFRNPLATPCLTPKSYHALSKT